MSQNNFISEKLEKIATKDVSTVDLRERVKAQVQLNPDGRLRFRLSPLAMIALVLVVAFALTFTVYATGPVIRQLLRMDKQLQNVDPSKVGQPLELTQTQGAVSIHLVWAYADHNRVLVGYTIKTEDGRRYEPSDLLLVDEQGNEYLPSGGYGVSGHSILLGVDLPVGESSYVQPFLVPEGKKNEQELTLTLRLNAIELILPTPAATQATRDTTNTPSNATVEALPLQTGQRVGPFEFHFTVQSAP